MDPYITTILILAICIILVVVMYRIGVEVGKVTVLREHTGYTPYGLDHIINVVTK
jgi:hypothetical protein